MKMGGEKKKELEVQCTYNGSYREKGKEEINESFQENFSELKNIRL